MKRSIAVVAVLAAVAVGCGPRVQSASFEPFAPRPVDHPIQLYSTKVPDCAYDEVGLVRVDKGIGLNSMDDILAALRQRARTMGGDAVVGVGVTQRVSGSGTGESVSIGTKDGLAGTVVRFTDDDCASQAGIA